MESTQGTSRGMVNQERSNRRVGVIGAGRSWLQLVVGLVGFGLAVPLMIRSGLGLGPWDAFHLGLGNLTGITVGTASILVGVAIVAGSYRLGIRPGPGTLVNMVLVGVLIDLVLPFVPPASAWAGRLAYYLSAIVLVGLATGMYIAANLGEGPRDGLMIGLSRRTGLSVRLVRTLIEVVVLAAGWAMGGPIGVGTVLFALMAGPATQFGLQLFGVVHAPSIRTRGTRLIVSELDPSGEIDPSAEVESERGGATFVHPILLQASEGSGIRTGNAPMSGEPFKE